MFTSRVDSASPGSGPTLLALDTGAGQCSVALMVGDSLIHRALPMTQGHSRVVLGQIDEVLAEAGMRGAQVDAIGYASGPGSFTGLRVACGVAQGLALGWSCPVVAVQTPTALALQAVLAAGPATSKEAGLRVAVALDLRMNEICSAVLDASALLDDGCWPEPIEPLALGPALSARERFERCDPQRLLLAGDGYELPGVLQDWAAGFVARGRRSSQAVQPDARAVARLARRGLALGRGMDAALAAPFYLRDKVALDVHEQAALRAARQAARADESGRGASRGPA